MKSDLLLSTFLLAAIIHSTAAALVEYDENDNGEATVVAMESSGVEIQCLNKNIAAEMIGATDEYVTLREDITNAGVEFGAERVNGLVCTFTVRRDPNEKGTKGEIRVLRIDVAALEDPAFETKGPELGVAYKPILDHASAETTLQALGSLTKEETVAIANNFIQQTFCKSKGVVAALQRGKYKTMGFTRYEFYGEGKDKDNLGFYMFVAVLFSPEEGQ